MFTLSVKGQFLKQALRNLLRLMGVILLLLVFSPVVYFLSGPYLDKRAIAAATEFWSSISVGETFDSVKAKSETGGISLEEWPPGPGQDERHIAIFAGFLHNLVFCEVFVVNNRVRARFVEEHFW